MIESGHRFATALRTFEVELDGTERITFQPGPTRTSGRCECIFVYQTVRLAASHRPIRLVCRLVLLLDYEVSAAAGRFPHSNELIVPYHKWRESSHRSLLGIRNEGPDRKCCSIHGCGRTRAAYSESPPSVAMSQLALDNDDAMFRRYLKAADHAVGYTSQSRNREPRLGSPRSLAGLDRTTEPVRDLVQ